MGCDFDAVFVTQTVFLADQLFTEAIEIARLYEKNFSRFIDESELSHLNRVKSMNVSKEFLSVYNISYDLYKRTGGIFNPLLQVDRIGYNQTFDNVRDVKKIFDNTLIYNREMDKITIDGNKIVLSDQHRLDFAGFLKGYVAQKIVENTSGDEGAIINIGGDIYTKCCDKKGQDFVLEIENPYDKKNTIKVSANDKALCTSGTYKRKWRVDGKEVCHILDQSTKKSVNSDVVSVSVLHKNGAFADAFATCAIVLGAREASKFFAEQDVDFALICKNGDIITSDIFKKKV